MKHFLLIASFILSLLAHQGVSAEIGDCPLTSSLAGGPAYPNKGDPMSAEELKNEEGSVNSKSAKYHLCAILRSYIDPFQPYRHTCMIATDALHPTKPSRQVAAEKCTHLCAPGEKREDNPEFLRYQLGYICVYPDP